MFTFTALCTADQPARLPPAPPARPSRASIIQVILTPNPPQLQPTISPAGTPLGTITSPSSQPRSCSTKTLQSSPRVSATRSVRLHIYICGWSKDNHFFVVCLFTAAAPGEKVTGSNENLISGINAFPGKSLPPHSVIKRTLRVVEPFFLHCDFFVLQSKHINIWLLTP